LLSANAISYYAGSSALFLAVLGVYLALFFGAFQVILWPIAIAERARPVRAVAKDASRALLRRPVQALVLCAALAIVNLAGLAAALLPFLSVTIAYSFLAAARFALPPNPTQEAID
jgi:sterol desaturase/sphingolipid hydroxylase (fatty acid hydroxylase superfamily)